LVGQHRELPHDDVADPRQRPEREADREDDCKARAPDAARRTPERRQCEAEEHARARGFSTSAASDMAAMTARMRKITTAGWSIGDLRRVAKVAFVCG